MSIILLVHHDADLYGADQSLLRTVRALQRCGAPTPVVALPRDGPLVGRLRAEGAEVHIGPLGKVSRSTVRLSQLPALGLDFLRALRFLTHIVDGRPVALVYTNSLGAIGGGLWAALHRLPRLWHVREIVVSPRLAAQGYPRLLQWLGGWCVCNSGATRDWIVSACPGLAGRSSVIWNGLEPVQRFSPDQSLAVRRQLGIGPAQVLVTMVGRINRWKGQRVLIEAAADLAARRSDVRFLIVGDVADGHEQLRQDMLDQIQRLGLQQVVQWQPFTPDVDRIWAASDIAVAPSIDPEPFGRVAIEAMAHRLPVIASNHGGLKEIVVDGRTGLLVPPGQSDALARAVQQLADDPDLRKAMGRAGALRQQQHFSQDQHDTKLLELIAKIAVWTPVKLPQGGTT